MDQPLSCLHPQPGWIDRNILDLEDLPLPSSGKMVGKHCILELYQCDEIKLNDEAFLRTTINSAAKIAGATVLNLITHRFQPQGITGLALLSESHISIHTWPEHAYAAVDVFTCGQHTNPERACNLLYKELGAKTYSLKCLDRETPEKLSESFRKPNLEKISSH